ncbi:MAG: hypothetical protein IPJ86_06485 [Bacteroidetes bacterium]|nr:hypothetical protein [Bacteroidota bacterium]
MSGCSPFLVTAQTISIHCIDSVSGAGIAFITAQTIPSGQLFFANEDGILKLESSNGKGRYACS